MKQIFTFLFTMTFLFCFCSCEHRPLVDLNTMHYIRVYVDEHIKNTTYGFYSENRDKPEFNRPNVMRVVLHDPQTDRMITDKYLQNSGFDENGYYLDGYINAVPGTYNLMTYNFGTESSQIKNENSYTQSFAYTNTIATHYYNYIPQARVELANDKIVYEPDHLFVDNRTEITIKETDHVDTLYNSAGKHFESASIVQTYYLQVRVKGIQWVTTGASLITNLAGSKYLHNQQMNEKDPVTLFLDMHVAELDKSTDEAIIYTTFNTFGKLPNKETNIQITFEFTKVDGKTQTATIDITPIFETELVKKEQWILIEDIIEIEPPTSVNDGGFKPGVDEWEDIWTDIII